MSARSPVRTVPPGSAIVTTSASTAEPAWARRLSSAARRAVDSLTVGSMMHIFKNRWVLASRLGSPWRDSTRTIVGTTGGHRSCALSAPMSDSAVLVRAARRDTPPLSRTSTSHPTRSSDRSRIRRAIASAVARCRWLGSPTSAASSSRYRSVSASASWRSNSSAERNLQEFRGREVALLQLFVEIFGQVHLNAGHTPNYTPTSGAYQQAVSVPQTAQDRHFFRTWSRSEHRDRGPRGSLSPPSKIRLDSSNEIARPICRTEYDSQSRTPVHRGAARHFRTLCSGVPVRRCGSAGMDSGRVRAPPESSRPLTMSVRSGRACR